MRLFQRIPLLASLGHTAPLTDCALIDILDALQHARPGGLRHNPCYYGDVFPPPA